MKSTSLATTLFLVFSCGILPWAIPKSNAQDVVVNGIAATVNGEVVTRAEVTGAVMSTIQLWLLQNQTASKAQRDAKVEEIKADALTDLINRRLILDEFKKMSGGTGIKRQYIDKAVDTIIRERFEGDRKKFNEELRKTGHTFPEFRKRQEEIMIVSYMRQQNSGEQIMVNTPKERQETFRKNRDDFATESYIKLRMISIKKQTSEGEKSAPAQKALVEELRKKLIDGADFASMAKTYSTDSRAADGGSMGTIGKDVLNKKLSDIAFDLEPRKISDVIDDGADWRLLYVDAKQEGKVPSLSEVQDQVDKMVTQEKRKKVMDIWLNRLRKNANVRVFSS